MSQLPDDVKVFIVKSLACFDTPSQVAEAVKEIFGLEVSRQQVYAYDPGCSQPPALRWRELYAVTRQAFLRENGDIGIAHRAVRLRRLDRLASRCERHSVALALRCLEIAAKECGGMFEKRKGVPSEPAAPPLSASQPCTPQLSTPEPLIAQPSVPKRPSAEPATAEPAGSEPAASPPRTSEPAIAQPSATQRAERLLSAPLPAMPQPSLPKAPPAGISPERYAELLRRLETSRAKTDPNAPHQPATGSAQISRVPPAS